MDGINVVLDQRELACGTSANRRTPSSMQYLASLAPAAAAALAALGLLAGWWIQTGVVAAWIGMVPFEAGILLLAAIASGSVAAEMWLGDRLKGPRDAITGVLGAAAAFGVVCAATHAGWPPRVNADSEVCVSLAAIAIALITLRRGSGESLATATARGAAVAVAGICFAASIGGERALHPVLAGLFLCGIGLLAAGAVYSPRTAGQSPGSVGMSAVREMIPFALAVPVVVTSFLVRAARLVGVEGDTLAFLNAGALVLILAATILCFGRTIDRMDARRADAEGDAASARDRLAVAQEAAGAASWEWNPETLETTRSPDLLRLHGFPPGDEGSLDDRNIPLLHPDDRERVLASLKATASGRGPFNERCRSIHSDGRTLHFVTRGRLIGEGAERRVVGLALDVTDRVMAEEMSARAAMLAERANVTKTKFFAAASHDMRQPLQAMFLYVGTLRDRLRDHPALGVVDAMDRALGAMRTLLDSLLDVSRIDAGLIVARPRAIEIGPLLLRIVATHSEAAAEYGLRLRAAPTSASASVDPDILERILGNLVSNALRYTATGGVVVGVRRRWRDTVRIEVVDTGIGIGTGDQDSIWEEFQQLANPERDRAKGLGLGLAVVRRLAALARHPIGMNSVAGRGSRFWIDLPAVRQEDPGASVMPPPLRRRKAPATVLVIDDEEILRCGFATTLQSWGYGVLLAADEREALAVVASHGAPPSVILADHRLRCGRTGIQAVAAIRQRACRFIPALLVTGDTDPERLAEAEKAGFRLLHKPVPTDALRLALADVLR